MALETRLYVGTCREGCVLTYRRSEQRTVRVTFRCAEHLSVLIERPATAEEEAHDDAN